MFYDFTQLFQMSDEVSEDFLYEFCEDFDETGFGPDLTLIEKNCVVEEKNVIITATFPSGTFEINKEDEYFEYNLKNVNKFFVEIDENDEALPVKDEDLLELEEDLQEFNPEFIYVAIFNNDIIETEVGDFRGNALEANIFEIARADSAIVKVKLEEQVTDTTPPTDTTQPTDTTPSTDIDPITEDMPTQEQRELEINQELILIGGGILLLIIVIIVIIKFKQKKNTSPHYSNEEILTKTSHQNPQANEKIQRIIDWIRQYEKQYPEHVLRQNLEKNPSLTKEEIDFAFKNK